jgi:Dolichyl-phosphate-mannose-protein mannosyltransferase
MQSVAENPRFVVSRLTPTRIAAAIVILAALAAGLNGIGRSLWLDEAWVANSVNAPTLSRMFVYPGWLQSNPPLFLLLSRAVVRWFGLSNASFRIVPLMFSLLAIVAMLAAGRELFVPSFAVLATALVAFHPTAIEYSHTLKPYSEELCATAILILATIRYLKQPTRREFLWLLAAAAISPPLAYASAFLLPGVFLALCATAAPDRGQRIALFTAITGGSFLAIYWFCIRPNVGSELYAFWATTFSQRIMASLALALLFCVAAVVPSAIHAFSRTANWRDWTRIVCFLPCLLLGASLALRLYPASRRTLLFLLPCFALLVMLVADDLTRRLRAPTRALNITAWGLTFVIVSQAIATPLIGPRDQTVEDFSGAVRFLTQHVAPRDIVLVHACCKEGFELYTGMYGWHGPPILYGETGWPCCARGKDARPGTSTKQKVFQDLDSKIPRGFKGRIWLVYTTRPTHWEYVGLDEANLWRIHVWEQGCLAGPIFDFGNLTVLPMNCAKVR